MMINTESKLIYQMIAIAMGVALSVLLTSFVYVPLPFGGLFNFTDVFIVLYSMFFGPWIGGAGGGFWGFLVDNNFGYKFFLPVYFFFKMIGRLIVRHLFFKKS